MAPVLHDSNIAPLSCCPALQVVGHATQEQCSIRALPRLSPLAPNSTTATCPSAHLFPSHSGDATGRTESPIWNRAPQKEDPQNPTDSPSGMACEQETAVLWVKQTDGGNDTNDRKGWKALLLTRSLQHFRIWWFP